MMKTSALDGTARRLLGPMMVATVLFLFVSGSVASAQGIDAATVKEWREAAEQGDAEAQYNLGLMYGKGDGVAENDVEAVKWYRKSAKQGNAGAQYNLGFMYYSGEGVVQNYVAAHMWWNLAGAQGIELARKNVEILVEKMTKEQIAEAQKMASEWQAKHSSELLHTAQAVIASDPLTKYSDNINLARLDTYLSVPKTEVGRMSRTALLVGHHFLYELGVMEPGGNEKFISFTRDCYDKAFSSGEMKSIMACYIAINVVTNQVERALKVNIRAKFDALLIEKLSEQEITDKTLLKQIFSEFEAAWKTESNWIETQTVKQVIGCIEFGIGPKCRY
jgi:TPR repeat protein